MKKTLLFICSVVALSVITGCSDNVLKEGQAVEAEAEEESVIETNESTVTAEVHSSSAKDESDKTTSEEAVDSDTTATAPEGTYSNTDKKEQVDELSGYTSEQIEYARVWHQLGVHQEIEELNVLRVPKGTAMNPKDEESGRYPEDVIHLAGGRLIDGSITYSGNGDGTINIYNVPHRWDGDYTKVGDEFYEDIINTAKLVMIEPAEGEEIKQLIELIVVQSHN